MPAALPEAETVGIVEPGLGIHVVIDGPVGIVRQPVGADRGRDRTPDDEPEVAWATCGNESGFHCSGHLADDDVGLESRGGQLSPQRGHDRLGAGVREEDLGRAHAVGHRAGEALAELGRERRLDEAMLAVATLGPRIGEVDGESANAPWPEQAAPPPRRERQHRVAATDLDLSGPIELVVLSVKEKAARCRLVGSDRVITLRASRLWDIVPGEIAVASCGCVLDSSVMSITDCPLKSQVKRLMIERGISLPSLPLRWPLSILWLISVLIVTTSPTAAEAGTFTRGFTPVAMFSFSSD